MTREEALKVIEENVTNKNIIKHMFATEAMMGGIFDYLLNKGKTEEELGGSRSEWEMAGLMHDGDYCDSVPVERQGIEITKIAKEKGYEIPDNVSHTMAAHNCHNTKVEPKNMMDWALFCGDSLTGLIVACALIIPSKKLSDIDTEFVLKKYKQPSFASGTRRDEIALCQENLGIPLEEFVTITLNSMKNISERLEL